MRACLRNSSVLIILLLIFNSVLAVRSQEDSLLQALKKNLPDTAKVFTLVALSDEYTSQGNYSKAIEIANQALAISEKIGFNHGISNACASIGSALSSQGNFPQALLFYTRSLEARRIVNDKEGIAGARGNIAMIQVLQGNYPEGLKSYFEALRIYQELGKKDQIAQVYANIGVAYMHQGNLDEALKYYDNAEKLQEKGKDVLTLANTIENKGIVYCQKGDLERGLENFKKALAIQESTNNKEGIAGAYNNIATAYYMAGDIEKVPGLLMQSLQLEKELGNKQGMADSYVNLGELYMTSGKYDKARSCLDSSLAIALEIGSKASISAAYRQLTTLDSTQGNYSKAFEHYKLHVFYQDSLVNEEKTKETVRAEMNYEFDKQQALQKADQEKKDAIASQELEKQTMQRNGFIAGFAGMLLLSGVTYRSYRNKKKANIIISQQKEEVERQKNDVEVQKHLVEEKNKEIIDSITYAKRLQQAILPPFKRIREALPQSFVLYRPKDIVAGDFYWMEQLGDVTFIAAADCTGHGVPGAMVSVVCANALNRTVKEFGITEPAAILDKVRELVIETFEKSESEVKDGMDISLCAINRHTGLLTWAGANNPLWMIRKGSSEIEEHKANKQPVGKMDVMNPFTNTSLQLAEGDTFYLFTDGYADQFGGEQGKKFKSANLKKLMLSMQAEPMEAQEHLLDATVTQWRGGLEQVDDICVIGIRW